MTDSDTDPSTIDLTSDSIQLSSDASTDQPEVAQDLKEVPETHARRFRSLPSRRTSALSRPQPSLSPPPPSLQSPRSSSVSVTSTSIKGRKFHPRSLLARPCEICTSEINVKSHYDIVACAACRTFMWKAACIGADQYDCTTGLYRCEITPLLNRGCRGCRLKKAFELGLVFTRMPQKRRSVTTPSPRHPANPKSATPPLSKSHDGLSRKIQVKSAEEIENGLDEVGLPLNIEKHYSRWFFGDFQWLGPGDHMKKHRRLEVRPSAKKIIAAVGDKIDQDFGYLTSDLDNETCSPIEELCLPILEIRPSVRLLKAQALTSSKGPRQNSSSERRGAKPLLTFLLNSRWIKVHRKPLVNARQNTSVVKEKYPNPSSVDDYETDCFDDQMTEIYFDN